MPAEMAIAFAIVAVIMFALPKRPRQRARLRSPTR
jgi:hypothetical protein